MNWFNRLPGFQRSAPGLEWWLLRRMPWIVVLGTLLPLLFGLALHAAPLLGLPALEDKTLGLSHYALAGLISLHWSLCIALTIGCVIVWLMKGPAYVADAYELKERDETD